MRPLRLDLAGFAVFREPTTVDFTDADFFALVGPTGSGKSTVLDAICFALYGTVPRWGDRRAIANALAPSATEARVRLVFESAGRRYVLSRVVRRDPRGKQAVSTRHAGLEEMPPGWDVGSLDTTTSGPDTHLGQVLAGTPAEVDGAVERVIGLPYEQFVKCVILPQGEFAAFLHAKPAERQRILVNLLGLDVYGRVRELAGAAAATAAATVTASDTILASLSGADQETIAEAARRVEDLSRMTARLERLLPELERATTATHEARTALGTLDREIATLSAHRVPSEASRVAAEVERARALASQAALAVTSAEEREEKLRSQLGALGDEAAMRAALTQYADLARLSEQGRELDGQVGRLQSDVGDAETSVAAARASASGAHQALERARRAYQAALDADRASALRAHVTLGQPCPVCERPIDTLPSCDGVPLAAAAETEGKEARAAADRADAEVERAGGVLRSSELALARARERSEAVATRRSELQALLVEAPPAEALRADLETAGQLRQASEEASEAVRAARTAQRTTLGQARLAEDRLRTAWAAFDSARDALAGWGPPAADREDLADAWKALVVWATGEAEERRHRRAEAVALVDRADQAVGVARGAIANLMADAGVSSGGGGDPGRVAAVELERARADHRRALERAEQARRVRKRRERAAGEAVVAKELASHLRSDRFERWLLAEALDSLVGSASQILRELSCGQYDLGYDMDRGEFFVVDHYDAGLRRGVRTLSGGETFQASLALALALSEQLAGATGAAASLDSILLDEGFGTLDASTIESVAATLENLAARGDRVVGIVTHVGGLAERIPVRFEVSRDARTARITRTGQ